MIDTCVNERCGRTSDYNHKIYFHKPVFFLLDLRNLQSAKILQPMYSDLNMATSIDLSLLCVCLQGGGEKEV